MKPAVIIPLDDHMGLDIARSLAKRRILVYGIDSNPRAAGKHSNSCRFVRCSLPKGDSEEGYLDFLIDFGRRLGGKAVLYPLNDKLVLLCSRYRTVLQEYYEFVMPDNDTVQRLTTKHGLCQVVREHSIPAPLTIFLNKTCGVKEVAGALSYPVILKPIESTHWHSPNIRKLLRKGFLAHEAKVILCNSPAELLEAYERISALDDRLVVQEVIPGEDSRLVYFSFYLDRHSKPLGIFAGQKCRILPVGFGSATYVRSFHENDLKEMVLSFLGRIRYQGLGGIEFKKDPRDGIYKLIEFNTRFGMWDGLSVKCGVDLPYLAYCDALHLPVEPELEYRDDVIWIDWQKDARAALTYWKKGQLTLNQWCHSLRGEKMSAIYSKDDWRPGAAFTLGLIQKIWQRIKGT
jgi:D-aspartate ligase